MNESATKSPIKAKPFVILMLTLGAVATAFYVRANGANDSKESIVSKDSAEHAAIPIFIELGSDRCTSCRAMVPVLDKLRNDHKTRLQVRFIDVWDHPTEGERYGVTTIPTQILLDPSGVELVRHTGFWSGDAIQEAFASHGYPLDGPALSRAP